MLYNPNCSNCTTFTPFFCVILLLCVSIIASIHSCFIVLLYVVSSTVHLHLSIVYYVGFNLVLWWVNNGPLCVLLLSIWQSVEMSAGESCGPSLISTLDPLHTSRRVEEVSGESLADTRNEQEDATGMNLTESCNKGYLKSPCHMAVKVCYNRALGSERCLVLQRDVMGLSYSGPDKNNILSQKCC